MSRITPAVPAESITLEQLRRLVEAIVKSQAERPAGSLLRLPEVLAIIPMSKASWYAGVKAGRYPAPVKVGLQAVAWKLEDILLLRERMVSGEAFGVARSAARAAPRRDLVGE